MGALGPSGLVGQGLENQAGTKAGQENRDRTGGWDERSRPGASTFHEGKAGGAYLLGQDNLLLHRLLGSLHGSHWGRRDREWGRPCWPLTLQSGVGMGQLAAWVWYKPNGTGRGSGLIPLSPPFLPEAAQGPWSPILRCLVLITIHCPLLQPRVLQG